MDFGKVLGRAWQITWRYKVLWVLGFLAALGQGTGSSGAPQMNYSFTGEDLERFSYQFEDSVEVFSGIAIMVLGLLCLAVIVVILLWVISVIARGGLIAAVQQVEEEGGTSFGRAWSAGARKFWTLFGLGVLAALPMIIFVVLGLIFLGIGITAGVGMLDMAEAAGITTITSVSILCASLMCCIGLPLMLVLEQIRIYGERAAILEDLGWIDAFKRGWQVLIENIGATLILWLIFFALGIVVFVISAGIALALFVPLMGMFVTTDPSWWWVAPICIGGLIGTLIYAVVRAIIVAFTSATWTLAYRDLTGVGDHPQLDNLELIEEV